MSGVGSPRLRLAVVAVALVGAGGQTLHAQAEPAGLGPGTYINAGVTGSFYQVQYGQQKLAGAAVFVDTNLYRRIGGEVEYRTLRFNASEGVRQDTIMAGPRLSLKVHRLRPYGKFLVGRGEFKYPFGYAHGSYFAFAGGAGIDWSPRKSRFTIRVIDVEYQYWPGFSFGPISPYGASAGLAFRLF